MRIAKRLNDAQVRALSEHSGAHCGVESRGCAYRCQRLVRGFGHSARPSQRCGIALNINAAATALTATMPEVGHGISLRGTGDLFP